MIQGPTLLRVDGTRTPVLPDNGEDFKLEQLYALLGCSMIEVVSIAYGMILVVDEEGKLSLPPKPVNSEATRLARGFISAYDHINGDALVCPSGMLL